MTIHNLLNEFARTLGLDSVDLADEDFVLEFDGNPVSLNYDERQERLLLYSDVGFLVKPSPELLLGLLEANAVDQAVGDGRVGVIADERRGGLVVVYSRTLAAEMLDLAILTKAMRDFVEVLEALRQSLAKFHDDLSDGKAGDIDLRNRFEKV